MEGFRTLGESDFGAIWYVEEERKIVVNAYQAAMYFGVDDFMHFAKMVETARKKLNGEREAAPPPAPAPAPAPSGSKIRQFRPNPETER